jgi:hypothetical protein
MNAEWAERAAAPRGALGGVEQELQHSKPRRVRGLRRWLAAGLAVAAIAGLFAARELRMSSKPHTGDTPAQASAFHRRDDLAPLMTLRMRDGVREATGYQTLIRESDGERRDSLTLGDPQSDGAFFRATVRVMGPTSAAADLFVSLAREAATMGLAIDRASSPEPYVSERGGLLVSDLVVEGARRRACIGFRVTGDAGLPDISGIACGAAGKLIERQALDCFLDRVRATPAGIATGIDKLLGSDPPERAACSRSS